MPEGCSWEKANPVHLRPLDTWFFFEPPSRIGSWTGIHDSTSPETTLCSRGWSLHLWTEIMLVFRRKTVRLCEKETTWILIEIWCRKTSCQSSLVALKQAVFQVIWTFLICLGPTFTQISSKNPSSLFCAYIPICHTAMTMAKLR
jgi:hypothetical protein